MDTPLQKIDKYRWMIPKTGRMRVPGLIFSNDHLIKHVIKEQSLAQVANVAALPGIVNYSLAMPDIHWGYGFPIGGVAAFEIEEGIVSPGGVGYDINCGCRLMTTGLPASEIIPQLKDLVSCLFKNIPAGVGSKGPLSLSKKELCQVAEKGSAWAVQKGYGRPADIEKTEDSGSMSGADPSVLSERALKRGLDQLGTLGSGNHFVEIQVVDQIFDETIARIFHLFEGQMTIFLHSGSRGFGHQICDDFLKEMSHQVSLSGLQLPDRQLAYASLKSDQGRQYLAAMACAANYAWANRQILMTLAQEAIMSTLSISPGDLKMELLYDVCHNIAKMERHTIKGREYELCVHRKGATRSLPPGHRLLSPVFKNTGQPVLIPGDMGTFSYVLTGTEGALEQSFGSCCHGAGRVLSRSKALKQAKGRAINRELEDKGIYIQSRGKKTLKEEMPEAYKDISQVVEVVHQAKLAKKVARLRPLGVIKG